MANLAFIFNGVAKEDEAITLMQECCERRQEVLGPDHLFAKSSADRLNEWRMERLRLDSLMRTKYKECVGGNVVRIGQARRETIAGCTPVSIFPESERLDTATARNST